MEIPFLRPPIQILDAPSLRITIVLHSVERQIFRKTDFDRRLLDTDYRRNIALILTLTHSFALLEEDTSETCDP